MNRSIILSLLCATFIHVTNANFDEGKSISYVNPHHRFLRRTNKNQDENYCNKYFREYKKTFDKDVKDEDTMTKCKSLYKTMQESIKTAEKTYESETEYEKDLYEEEVKAAKEVYEDAIHVADANFKNATKDYLDDYENAEKSAKSTFESNMSSYLSSTFGFTAYQFSYSGSGSSSGSLVAASGVVGVAAVATFVGVMNRHRNMVASSETNLMDTAEGAYTAPNDGLAWETFSFSLNVDPVHG